MVLSEKKMMIDSEAQQSQLGAQLAFACLHQNCVIYLQGEMGAGKTTFARGFIKALGYTGKVKSPTYTLIEQYDIDTQKILHIDLYRLNTPEEVFMLGLKENIRCAPDENIIYLIEWPEKALNELPAPDITCTIAPFKNKRCCGLSAHTELGNKMMQSFLQTRVKK